MTLVCGHSDHVGQRSTVTHRADVRAGNVWEPGRGPKGKNKQTRKKKVTFTIILGFTLCFIEGILHCIVLVNPVGFFHQVYATSPCCWLIGFFKLCHSQIYQLHQHDCAAAGHEDSSFRLS